MIDKMCHRCEINKPIEEFYPHRSGKFGVSHICKSCAKSDNNSRYHNEYKNDKDFQTRQRIYARLCHQKHKERNHQRIANNNRKQRLTCINHYGGKCACCGEMRYEFLTIDHINGGGGKHRAEIGGHIYRWLIKNNMPLGFRVLCHNCNASIGLYNYCPHQHVEVRQETSRGIYENTIY